MDQADIFTQSLGFIHHLTGKTKIIYDFLAPPDLSYGVIRIKSIPTLFFVGKDLK